MAEKTKLPVLGVIENMSYYDVNGERDYIFGRDGGKDLARTLGVPFIGEIPINTKIREAADAGNPIALDKENKIAAPYIDIARTIAVKDAKAESFIITVLFSLSNGNGTCPADPVPAAVPVRLIPGIPYW